MGSCHRDGTFRIIMAIAKGNSNQIRHCYYTSSAPNVNASGRPGPGREDTAEPEGPRSVKNAAVSGHPYLGERELSPVVRETGRAQRNTLCTQEEPRHRKPAVAARRIWDIYETFEASRRPARRTPKPNPPQTRQTRQTGHKPCRDDRKLAPLVREIGRGLNAQWQKTGRWNVSAKSGT